MEFRCRFGARGDRLPPLRTSGPPRLTSISARPTRPLRVLSARPPARLARLPVHCAHVQSVQYSALRAVCALFCFVFSCLRSLLIEYITHFLVFTLRGVDMNESTNVYLQSRTDRVVSPAARVQSQLLPLYCNGTKWLLFNFENPQVWQSVWFRRLECRTH